jgi:hypothetical protein
MVKARMPGRFPRTMKEAFGPYTDDRLWPMPEKREPRWFEKVLRWFCGF